MNTKQPTRTIRCAIYTRKSTEEGLNQDFNSLDAQREAAEAYIASQKAEGWVMLPERYDDGGFTGGNMVRPALRRLLDDIASGGVDCVVVYKVDRLSRSLMDFARVVEVFEKHHVTFVSVTQHFNTTHSMGRLTLNILLSFAQFEREIISERTRDKIAATRRKGKWSGGCPILGYDVERHAGGQRLVVNEDEAHRVRQIFELYLQQKGLIPLLREVDSRGWTMKRWMTKAGVERGGQRFDKSSLYNLLTNVTYAGKLRYKAEVHEGEHEAIVPAGLWQRVQARLQANARDGGAAAKNKHGGLLRGLLRCSCCDSAMGHTFTTKGSKQYRYYACVKGQKRGSDECPARSIPAHEVEAFVVEQIRQMACDPAFVAETMAQATAETDAAVERLTGEGKALAREIAKLQEGVRAAAVRTDESAVARLADLQERLRLAERRAAEVEKELAEVNVDAISEAKVAAALREFEPLWATLSANERAELIQLLVQRVDYDGNAGTVAITLHPTGIRSLTTTHHHEEAA